jgi:hypothetical protein
MSMTLADYMYTEMSTKSENTTFELLRSLIAANACDFSRVADEIDATNAEQVANVTDATNAELVADAVFARSLSG